MCNMIRSLELKKRPLRYDMSPDDTPWAERPIEPAWGNYVASQPAARQRRLARSSQRFRQHIADNSGHISAADFAQRADYARGIQRYSTPGQGRRRRKPGFARY